MIHVGFEMRAVGYVWGVLGRLLEDVRIHYLLFQKTNKKNSNVSFLVTGQG
jgi:hypothetical protein